MPSTSSTENGVNPIHCSPSHERIASHGQTEATGPQCSSSAAPQTSSLSLSLSLSLLGYTDTEKREGGVHATHINTGKAQTLCRRGAKRAMNHKVPCQTPPTKNIL